jgi:hypothetical protein
LPRGFGSPVRGFPYATWPAKSIDALAPCHIGFRSPFRRCGLADWGLIGVVAVVSLITLVRAKRLNGWKWFR